jgi:branched-chain amino acid transport system permease protein
VLFILVVMFLPGGIAGTVDSWRRRRRGAQQNGAQERGGLDALEDQVDRQVVAP